MPPSFTPFLAVTTVDTPDALPAAAGAYALVLRLHTETAFTAGRLGRQGLPPGGYLYAGSAKGPGGIRARVRRHARAAKRVHWHLDRLTNQVGVAAALALPGGTECGLVAALAARAGVTVPVPGLGSTDCRACPAHFLGLWEDFDLAAEAPALALAAGASAAVLWHRPPVTCFAGGG